jgi:hypothetical protein
VEIKEEGEVRKYNKRTKLDQHNNYPPWMNQRAIKKLKKTKRLSKKKK